MGSTRPESCFAAAASYAPTTAPGLEQVRLELPAKPTPTLVVATERYVVAHKPASSLCRTSRPPHVGRGVAGRRTGLAQERHMAACSSGFGTGSCATGVNHVMDGREDSG